MTTESPLLFGKYQLLERVARGGMAEVFKAKSYGVEGFEKLVVLKRILPELAQNQQFVDMFLSEARLSVALSHANIVQVFDLGREEDTYFIAMEYVVGMDLAQCLRQCRRMEQRLPMELAVYITGEVARALDYAHRRRDALGRTLGVVHRDISPQNVLLSYEGEVKVVDFGIAKARTTLEEPAGAVKGKYAYMAPEQAGGTAVDGRADIYALGVTLYEALSGVNPFTSDHPFETMRRVLAGEWQRLRELASEVPAELCRIVETAMRLDPAGRYATAAKMYEELAGFLYTTGKRVGPHDLAEWLQSIRGAVNLSDEGRKIVDAVTADSRPSRPVPEIGGSAESAPGRSNAGLGGLRMERRDATFLAVELRVSHTLAGQRPGMDFLVAPALRRGARIHAQGEGWAVLLFSSDGRESETATRCALRIEALGARTTSGMELGIGILAARVHVSTEGAMVADERLASALESARALAQRGRSRVMVSRAVARAVREVFELEESEGDGWFVTAERSGKSGTFRKMVGRTEVFKRFGETLAAAANAGLRVVSVEGEAGVGKSRTLDEVLYRLRRMKHEVNWYAASCIAPERGEPSSALRAMLRAVLGIDESDAEGVMREKARRLRELGLNPEEMLALGTVLGVVSASISSGGASEEASRPLRNALVKVATRLAQDKLTVLVWDSAEHMDDASEGHIAELMARADKARLVLIVSSRPGRRFAWSGREGGLRESLSPLSEDKATWLVALRLGVSAELPAELVDDLWSKSGGLPLHLEEYLYALMESGAVRVEGERVSYTRPFGAMEVPRTLRGLVASRVALVGATERRLMQAAAVMGPRFGLSSVEALSGLGPGDVEGALSGLLGRGFWVALSGEEYSFAYELLREVMYESIPTDARREAHDAVSKILEALGPERVDEHAERLARHHLEAGRPVVAAGYIERAAQRQRSEQAYEAAVASLLRALELCEGQPGVTVADELRMLSELSEVCILGGAHAQAIQRLSEGARRVLGEGESAVAARLLGGVGRLHAREGRVPDAVASHEEAIAALSGSMEHALRVSLVGSLGAVLLAAGDVAGARAQLVEAVKLSVGAGMEKERARALMALAKCQSVAKSHDEAMLSLDRVSELPSEALDLGLLRDVEKARASVMLAAEDFEGALGASGRAVDFAREAGEVSEVCAALCVQGEMALRAGDEKRAFTALGEARDLSEEHGVGRWSLRAGVFLAALDARMFKSEEDLGKVTEGLEKMARGRWAADLLAVRYGLGLMAHGGAEVQSAREHLEAALEIARKGHPGPWVEDCERALRALGAEDARGRNG